MTKEQYDSLQPFKQTLILYVESNINAGIDTRALEKAYKQIDPNETIDLWCSGCVDIMFRRCYDFIMEYERSNKNN